MKRSPGQVPMTPATFAATVAKLEQGGTPQQSAPDCPGCAKRDRDLAKLRQKVRGLEAEGKQLRMTALGLQHRLAELRGGKGE